MTLTSTQDISACQGVAAPQYAHVTGCIINDLVNSIGLIKTDRQEEAKTILKGMCIAVKTLSSTAHACRERFAHVGQVTEMQLEELEKVIGTTYQHEQDIEKSVRDIMENLTKYEQQEALTEEHQRQLVSDINGIRNKIAQLQEIRKYMLCLLVFGVAGAIAAATAIAVENNQLDSKNRELARMADELNKDQVEIQGLLAKINQWQREIEDDKQKLNGLQMARKDLEEQSKTIAARLVFLLKIEEFYGSLDEKLRNIDHRIDDILDIVDILQSEVVTPALEKGEMKAAVSLREALVRFAEYVDKGAEAPGSNNGLLTITPG